MAREFNYRVARWLNKGLMVVGGTVTSKQDAVDYLTWTYFFRRLVQNPTYYNLESTEYADVNEFLSGLVENTLAELEDARCLEVTFRIRRCLKDRDPRLKGPIRGRRRRGGPLDAGPRGELLLPAVQHGGALLDQSDGRARPRGAAARAVRECGVRRAARQAQRGQAQRRACHAGERALFRLGIPKDPKMRTGSTPSSPR
eukprot:767048-Prorocentrum_minimum.AAC.1